MDRIPVFFEFQADKYWGYLHEVQGAGSSSTWHLSVSSHYLGRLRIGNGQWIFDSNSGMEELAETLGEFVIAWHG